MRLGCLLLLALAAALAARGAAQGAAKQLPRGPAQGGGGAQVAAAKDKSTTVKPVVIDVSKRVTRIPSQNVAAVRSQGGKVQPESGGAAASASAAEILANNPPKRKRTDAQTAFHSDDVAHAAGAFSAKQIKASKDRKPAAVEAKAAAVEAKAAAEKAAHEIAHKEEPKTARTRVPSKEAQPLEATEAAAAAKSEDILPPAADEANESREAAAAAPIDEDGGSIDVAVTEEPEPLPAANAFSSSANEASNSKAEVQVAASTAATTLLPAPFLYAGSPVEALTAKHFCNDRLCAPLNASRLVIVNFFSSSCGHCISHAPTWKRVGSTFSSPPKLIVAALDCDLFRDTCTVFGAKGTPFIRAFIRGVPDDGPALSEDYEQFAASVRLRFAAVPAAEAKVTNVLPTLHPHQKKRRKSSLAPKQRVIHDASTAIRYGLNVGVFLGRSAISGDVLNALVQWLQLLSAVFPTRVGRWKLSWLLSQVVTRSSPTSSLESTVFDQILEGWDFANTHGEPIQWHHCQSPDDGEPGGGYSCAQWLLFHIIAQRAPAAELSSELNPAVTIHSFVKYFFGCIECRENFLKKNPTPPKVDASGLAMWLWQEHNSVSARLNLERAEDQALSKGPMGHYHAKVPFPPAEACEACYKGGVVDETVVARYLENAYGFEEAATSSHGHADSSEGLGLLGWLSWMVFFSGLVWLSVGGLMRKSKKRDGKWM